MRCSYLAVVTLLQQFFAWRVDEEEIATSPMA